MELRHSEKTFEELLRPYLSRWKWVVLSLAACAVLALVYLRYTSDQYRTTAKILIRDEKRDKSTVNQQVFSDLGSYGGSGSIDNELEVLQSHTLMRKVADSLDLYVTYLKQGRVKMQEIYLHSPMRVEVVDYDRAVVEWEVRLGERGRFLVADREGGHLWEVSAGEFFDTPAGSVRIMPADGDASYPIVVKLAPWNGADQIRFHNTNKLSSVIDISLVSACPEKSEDVIDMLIRTYNSASVDGKRRLNEQTIDFIDDRLQSIAVELEVIERDVENYKQTHQLADLRDQVGLYLSIGSEYERQRTEISVQRDILVSIGRYISDPANRHNVIPSNMGITDRSLITLIDQYNNMQLTRREGLTTMTEENPQLIDMNRRIEFLREAILAGINGFEQSYDVTLGSLERQEQTYSDRLQGLSTNEREYQSYLRKKELTEAFYIYMLEKREESAITFSMAEPNARVIDPAHTIPDPVKPDKKVILLAALLLGLIFPLGTIYLLDMFSVKITGREDFERATRAPILGQTPERGSKEDVSVGEGDTSGASEQYRTLTVNLDFLLAPDEKVLMVTSSVPYEGKSSFAVNLAMAWATVGKKVLLVDLDLRDSRLGEILKISQSPGLLSYLKDATLSASFVIRPGGSSDNLSVVTAGFVPSNPVALLQGERLDEFFRVARKDFDMIIVDTPPVLQVSDALIVNRVSDMTLYISRVGVTRKPYLKMSEKLYHEGKFKKMYYVIKGIPGPGGYGYGAKKGR